jgi:glycosyltransferase involved in cell wall biosynthesis
MESQVTVLIYTYNNQSHISDCIDSARLISDQIIVVDQNSQDGTEHIAQQKKVKLVRVPHHMYVEPVRMHGIAQVKEGWILILDADERITKDLAYEIRQKLSKGSATHYQIPRKNIFAYKTWMAHGGWYPDYQTRLIKRSSIRDWPVKIHSTPVIDGASGTLVSPMIHYFHGDLSSMVNKTVVYEEIESELLFNAKRAASTPIFFRKFLGELYRRLIKDAGWKDGTLGVIESMYQAYSKTVTYLFLYEKQKT